MTYEVGAKVQLVPAKWVPGSDYMTHVGQVGTVTRGESVSGFLLVKFDDGLEMPAFAEELVPVTA